MPDISIVIPVYIFSDAHDARVDQRWRGNRRPDQWAVTVNVLADEEAAFEFLTVTFGDPEEASWALVTAAVSEAGLPYVVASAVAPHSTVEPLTKFDPVTVSVKGTPPATAEAGLSNEIEGPLTVNVLAVEDAALEFRTATFGDPAAASWVAVTAAVSEVALP